MGNKGGSNVCLLWYKSRINHPSFWECQCVQQLWKQVFESIQMRFTDILHVNPRNIICNTIVEKKGSAVNSVCLLTKQYTYRQRCLGKEKTFSSLKVYIRHVENIEKYIQL